MGSICDVNSGCPLSTACPGELNVYTATPKVTLKPADVNGGAPAFALHCATATLPGIRTRNMTCLSHKVVLPRCAIVLKKRDKDGTEQNRTKQNRTDTCS